MTTVAAEGMAIEVDGTGDPVILVHGLGGTSNTFTPQLAALTPRLRAIRPDLPGSGRSNANGPLSIQAFVDHIARAAQALGVARGHFAGHSLGTIVCQHLAVQHPSLVRSLALVGPFPAPPAAAREGLRSRAKQARSEGMASIADAVVQAATSADTKSNQPVAAAFVRELLMRQCPEGYARTCEALADAEAADLDRIKCATLLVTGDEDAVAPPSVARGMAERIAGSRTTILNRCGHWTTIERAADCSAALRDFYSGRADRKQERVHG